MSDKILLTGAHFFARHGVDSAEREVGGRLVVDVELTYDLARAGASDDVADTISYADIYEVVREIVETRSFHLVEALAETIAQALLERFRAEAVLVRVRKDPPPIAGIVDHAGVEITRAGVEITRGGKGKTRPTP
jgi:dihydroneopterin aldolase